MPTSAQEEARRRMRQTNLYSEPAERPQQFGRSGQRIAAPAPVSQPEPAPSAMASTPMPANALAADGSNFGAASDRPIRTLISADSRTTGGRGDTNMARTAGGRTFYASDYPASQINTVDMAGGTSAIREANAIRQQMIDEQAARNQARAPRVQAPDFNAVAANVDTRGLSASAGRSMRQAALESSLGAYESAQDRQSRERMSAQDNASAMALQQMRNDGTLAAANAGDQASMERLQFASDTLSVEGILAMLSEPDMPEETQLFLEDALLRRIDSEPDEYAYAEGGLVDPVVPLGAMGGASNYAQAPQQPQQPEIQEYQRYVSGAQGMGIPAVPFEEFLSMRSGAAAMGQGKPAMPQMVEQPQGALAFAEGGSVPDPSDVSGAMVIDPDPMAGTDSIPAMIDGKVPAKLDSGEFVIPDDVTRFFGTKKLNDMIQQARSAMQEANAAPGPAM